MWDDYRPAMSQAQAKLRDAIEQCYTAFADMPRPRRLEASPMRDADKILRTLTSAPLRELSGEQIGPYSGWAITTVGDADDYRHFLPRILKLSIVDPVWLGTEPPVMASKLNMASWRDWPAAQRSAVLHIFNAAFEFFVELHPDDAQAVDGWFCGLATLGQSVALTLERWRCIASPNAGLQMASFVNDNAKDMHRHGEIRHTFWETVNEDARREVTRQLLLDVTADFLRSTADRVSEEDRFYLTGPALHELQRLSHP
jgi:hypothetical protein